MIRMAHPHVLQTADLAPMESGPECRTQDRGTDTVTEWYDQERGTSPQPVQPPQPPPPAGAPVAAGPAPMWAPPSYAAAAAPQAYAPSDAWAPPPPGVPPMYGTPEG